MKKNINKEKTDPKKFLYLLSTLLVVFIVYSFSLFRPWQPFDERLIYNEELFPIPNRISEIPEIIKHFVCGTHVISMNTFYSNFVTFRTNPITFMLMVVVSSLFKKNAFFYHFLQLTIHLINVLLLWLILYKATKILKGNEKDSTPDKTALILISLFTLLWGIHSANSEAIMLVTNWPTILTYSSCLLFTLYEISKITKKNFKVPLSKTFLFSVLFCLVMFLTEYGYSFPFIVFFVILAFSRSFGYSLKASLPYFIGLLLFVFFSFTKSGSPINNLFTSNSFHFFIERNLWFTPQIFFHLIMLILFPIKLTTYQSNLVHFADNLIEPYSIFCTTIYVIFLALPILFFITHKKSPLRFIYLLIYAFYFALLPFLHVLSPIYCLSADRYCYFPSCFFILFIFLVTYIALKKNYEQRFKVTTTIIVCIITILLTRTFLRINNWYNPISFYKAAIETDKSSLYKGQKLSVLGNYLGSQGMREEMQEAFQDSLRMLSKSLKELKVLRKKYKEQPYTLKLYGLDYDSLLFKGAYAIATIKNDNYLEDPKKILEFFEPYIKSKLHKATLNQIILYADILIRGEYFEKAKKVLELGLEKYPFSDKLMIMLIDDYLIREKNPDKSFKIIQKAYEIFPNDLNILQKFYIYYEQKNDLNNLAKFAYLIGLRDHSMKAYQNAAKIYLDTNQLDLANKSLKKAIRLGGNMDPLTLLLVSRYLDLTNKRSKIVDILNDAFTISKAQGEKQDLKVTKSILISLININAIKGNTKTANEYINEFEMIKGLTYEDRVQINETKKRLKIEK